MSVIHFDEQISSFLGVSTAAFHAQSQNDRSRALEEFLTFQVLHRWHLDRLARAELQCVLVGASEDNQVDALAILVNGRLAQDEAHVRALFDAADDVQVDYVFVQVTGTPTFNRAKMNGLVTGVENFFAERAWFPENQALVAKRRMKEVVRALLGEDRASRESVSVYFAALGRWMQEPLSVDGPRGWRKYAEEKVKGIAGVEAPPKVEVLDLARLGEVIREVEALRTPEVFEEMPLPTYSRRIPAPHLVPIPDLAGRASGYLGYVAATDLIQLLERDDGQGLLDILSYHNVRAFQGMENKVNAEIAKTLAEPSRDEFLLRNNGVTVIATDAEWTEGLLRLDNYQIVNGWQTTSVLYRQRHQLGPQASVHVPLKVVVTTDGRLRDAIVRSTNRQTSVGDLQHIGHSAFVRRLWTALRDLRVAGAPEPMWLERRDGEFRDDPSVDERRVVSLRELLGAVTAVVLHQPHVPAAGGDPPEQGAEDRVQRDARDRAVHRLRPDLADRVAVARGVGGARPGAVRAALVLRPRVAPGAAERPAERRIGGARGREPHDARPPRPARAGARGAAGHGGGDPGDRRRGAAGLRGVARPAEGEGGAHGAPHPRAARAEADDGLGLIAESRSASTRGRPSDLDGLSERSRW